MTDRLFVAVADDAPLAAGWRRSVLALHGIRNDQTRDIQDMFRVLGEHTGGRVPDCEACRRSQDHKCAGCGELISPHSERCPPCARERKSERQRERWQQAKADAS